MMDHFSQQKSQDMKLFKVTNPSVLTQKPEFSSFLAQAQQKWENLYANRHDKDYSFLHFAFHHENLTELKEIATNWRKKFKNFIVLGTGGSSLGAQTLTALTKSYFSLDSPCSIYFMDNIDPHTFKDLIAHLNFQETGFLVISKSGSTAETLCQLFTILPHYSQQDLKNHVFTLTEPKESPLKQVSTKMGLHCFDHSQDVGGRFSVFTNVGLLPAAIANVDIEEIHQGARHFFDHPESAIQGAALSATAAHYGYSQNVLMPYCDRLRYFTFWFRQLWAESLGKNGKGTTPLNALGTVDQHSQLQLYLDGPQDKFFNLIFMEEKLSSPLMSVPSEFQDLSYLDKKGMENLRSAEQKATAQTLINRGCPARIFTLSHLDEKVMGALLMHYILETLLTAQLLNINAFDQPAVEESKILTRHYLKNS